MQPTYTIQVQIPARHIVPESVALSAAEMFADAIPTLGKLL